MSEEVVTEDFDYVAGLAQVMKDEGFTIPGKDLSNPDMAKAIYEVHMALKDPVENIVSRIGGLLMLKSDSVFCMENRVQLGEKILPVELTQGQKNRLRSLKEDIEVLTAARDMIEQLRR